MGTCSTRQMQEALASTRTSEDKVRAQQEQQRKDLQQRTDEVHAEAVRVEASFRDLQRQLEELKAGERLAQIFHVGGCHEPPGGLSRAGHEETFHSVFVRWLVCPSRIHPSIRPSCFPV